MKEKEKKSQKKELTALLKKVQADFENYKKRVDKEQKKFTEYASQDFVKSLLPILDSFEFALKESDNKDIKVLYDQLWNTLSSQGLTKINALNHKFNPHLHEALMQEASDKEEGTVLEELQSGFMFKDNVIRSAKVKVSKK